MHLVCMINQIKLEILKVIKKHDKNINEGVNLDKLKREISIKRLKLKRGELKKEVQELNDLGYIYESFPKRFKYLG